MTGNAQFVVGSLPGSIGSAHLETGKLTAAQGGQNVAQRAGLPFFYLYNSDSATHTVTAVPRAAVGVAIAVPFSILSGQFVGLPTATFAAVQDANANGDVYWWYSDVALGGPNIAAGSGTGLAGKSSQTTAELHSLASITEMFGFGTTNHFTPNTTGAVLVQSSGYLSFTYGAGVTSVGGILQAYFGTGTAPANGAATTGTLWPGANTISVEMINTGATETTMIVPVGWSVLFNGANVLTKGTAYWFDWALFSTQGSPTAVAFSLAYNFSEYPS
jgi:hypothetical protein